MRRSLITSVLVIVAAVAASACGGDSNPPSVRLANSPIPTVTIAIPTFAVCAPEQPGTLPANFPSDVVPIPPDLVVFSVETEPYLRVVGRVTPPPDVRPPHIVVGEAMNFILGETFDLELQVRVEGQDWNFSHADGRRGHYNAKPVAGCFGQVEIVLDLEWVTPDTPPPPPSDPVTPAEPDV